MHAFDDRDEARTRTDLIDPRLRDAKWDVVNRTSTDPADYGDAAVPEWPADGEPADYALCTGRQVLGVVEAKREAKPIQEVLEQAERYAKNLRPRVADYPDGIGVPFLYSTNGRSIRFRDARHELGLARDVAGFHTPGALREMLAHDRDAALDKLSSEPFHAALRPYQETAIEKVEAALRRRQRNVLLAMATGTGKTLTTVSMVYRLMKAGVARRVLFLVDRRALAAQAVTAFVSFEPEPGRKFDGVYELYSQKLSPEDLDGAAFGPTLLPAHYLTAPDPNAAFVYVSTVQRVMINLFGRQAEMGDGDETEPDADRLDIPIHAFDLVVVDECHRGYTGGEAGLFRQTLDHFDAVRVGLTATPTALTTAYFGPAAFRYEYERAVLEGHLVDYDLVKIHSGVHVDGVFLNPGDVVDVVDPETGMKAYDTLEDEREFSPGEVEAKITAPDANRKILEEVKRYADEHEAETGRFPKTLIFAANDLKHTSHADQLVELAREVFGRGEAFVRKITGRVDRPLRRLKEFRNEPKPGVVVTVDMLTTGVDVPDLEFIVFLRSVKSRVLFEQMLGRGTRKGRRHPDKSHFVVFDCFGGSLVERFKGATSITADPPTGETATVRQLVDRIANNQDRERSATRLAKRLLRIDREVNAEGRDRLERFVEDGDLAAFARALPDLLRTDLAKTVKRLRDSDFLDLLENPPRTKAGFVIDPREQEEVTSERVVRENGKEYKPSSYLAAFGRFVYENSSTIDALRVLLTQPDGWSRDELQALRKAVRQGGFSEAGLRKALRLDGQTPEGDGAADLLSIVHHTADPKRPLLTAAGRARRARDRAAVRLGGPTPEQARWLDRLEADLRENLSVDSDDFDLLPVLADPGGLGAARRAFGDALDDVLRALNAGAAEGYADSPTDTDT